MSQLDDFPTLVSSLQASTVEWGSLGSSVKLSGSGVFSSANLRNRYLRYVQVLQQIDEAFALYRLSPSCVLVSWCASLQPSGVARHFVSLLVDHVLQGLLPYVALQRCLRLLDTFLSWTTRPNAGSSSSSPDGQESTSPVLIPNFAVVKWAEQTWVSITNLAKDNAGSSTASATAALCGALQLLPVLLRWNVGPSPLPPFRRALLPNPVNMQSEEARLLSFRLLPVLLQHQPVAAHTNLNAVSHEMIEYVRRGCVKCSDLFVRIAAGSALRGLLERGLRVSSPAVAFMLMDMLLRLCDDVSLYDLPDEMMHNVGVAMGYLLAFYQSDFTLDTLTDVLQAATPTGSKAAGGGGAGGEDRAEAHRRGGGGDSAARGTGGNTAASSMNVGGCGNANGGSAVAGRLRWKFFGGSDAVEGSRIVQRCFNDRMTRTAQRSLATALATLCGCCATPATTASVINCCFVLLVPIGDDARAYMPRLLADAILEWAQQLPSNGYRVVLADVLRGYVQRSGDDKTVVRTAMVALHGVMRTLSSSLEIGFNVADDVLAAVHATPSLLHTGVEVLGAVARTNYLYARHLQHLCAGVDTADVANTIAFQLQMRALLDAAFIAIRTTAGGSAVDSGDALSEEDRVSLVHVCIRLLLRLSRGDPPRTVQDIHYRQAELIFRLTQLIYGLLHGSPVRVLAAVRAELQPCTLGFMNLLVSSPASTIAFYKAVTAASEMLRKAPVVSDTEKMLAVGFLESRLASQSGVARHSTDASLSSSAAASAYFAVSKGALFQLVARNPWRTCRDDGSLRWLAAQALKDVARACGHGVPVFCFAEVHDAIVASAAQSMRLVRRSLLSRRREGDAGARGSSAAAETPAHPLEECGGHAVRLLRWTLRHFLTRGNFAVCVSLFASIYAELYQPYLDPAAAASPANASVTNGSEEAAQLQAKREMALWNTLCAVHEFLQEAPAGGTGTAAAALWANSAWKAEVSRWQTLTTRCVLGAAAEAMEVRLVAAKVLGLCLVSTHQVDAFTSRTVNAVGHGMVGKGVPYDFLGALMVLCEVHSRVGEVTPAFSTRTSGGTREAASSATLPLATSLLAEAWKQLASSVVTTFTISAPVLTLLSLRLAQIYPAEVEAALSDNISVLLLSPMTATNRQWWCSSTATGMLTAVVQLWRVFPGKNDPLVAVPHSAALAVVQASLTASRQAQYPVKAVTLAALDVAAAYTEKQEALAVEDAEAAALTRGVLWRRLLHQCLEDATILQHEGECGPCPLLQLKGSHALQRLLVDDDDVSRRLARLWYAALVGTRDEPLLPAPSPSTNGTDSPSTSTVGDGHLLSAVDTCIQVDVATATVVRRAWVSVAQAVYVALHRSPLHDRTGRSWSADTTQRASFVSFLAGLQTILQSRAPDVQVDLAKRDSDMFAATDEDGAAAAASNVRGGGSDSDDGDNYRDEYDDGGILGEEHNGVEGGGGGEGDRRTHDPSAAGGGAAGTGGSLQAAASLTFDVAAKEAAMWVLFGVLRRLRVEAEQVETRALNHEQRAETARQALLPMVVAAAQIVEVHPEVQLATIGVLREVIAAWGHASQPQGRSVDFLNDRSASVAAAPALLPWKTQLVVGLTTVLQHGLLSLEGCTALAVQYSRCNLADASSCRRVMRSLLLLLHACHRLHDRRRSFLLGRGGSAGHILVALAKVAESPSLAHVDGRDGNAQQAMLLRTFASPPCQAALTLLCERFVTAVALANGYVQSADAFGGWQGEDDDGDDTGAGGTTGSSMYGSLVSMSAADVLQAVAFMTGAAQRTALGPALRYATGCLACLALATALHAEITATESNADANHCTSTARGNSADRKATATPQWTAEVLTYVVALSDKLTSQHQRLLAEIALQRLMHLAAAQAALEGRHSTSLNDKSNGDAPSPGSEPSGEEKYASLFDDECVALLRITAAASVPLQPAEELLRVFAPSLALHGTTRQHSSDAGASPPTAIVAALLCIGLSAKAAFAQLRPLYAALSVDVLTRVPSDDSQKERGEGSREMVRRLQLLTAAYVQDEHESLGNTVRAVAMAGPAGCVLVGQCVCAGDLPAACAPSLDRELWPSVLQVLLACPDPVQVIQQWWGTPAASKAPDAAPGLLRECVSYHEKEAHILLALLGSLDTASHSRTASAEAAAVAVLHCGPLLCELLLGCLLRHGGASSPAPAIYDVLLYVVTALSSRVVAAAYALALADVGRHLVRTVAPSQSAALRDAIHRLGPMKAAQLRIFMEASCT